MMEEIGIFIRHSDILRFLLLDGQEEMVTEPIKMALIALFIVCYDRVFMHEALGHAAIAALFGRQIESITLGLGKYPIFECRIFGINWYIRSPRVNPTKASGIAKIKLDGASFMAKICIMAAGFGVVAILSMGIASILACFKIEAGIAIFLVITALAEVVDFFCPSSSKDAEHKTDFQRIRIEIMKRWRPTDPTATKET